MYSGEATGLERIDKMAFFDYSPELVEAGKKAMELCAPQFAEFDRMAEYNGERVLKAFIDNRISDIHMKGTNGYGYGDDGRDKLDAVFAQILSAEDALVRHNFVNGTHAITTALFGILRPGDELLSRHRRPLRHHAGCNFRRWDRFTEGFRREVRQGRPPAGRHAGLRRHKSPRGPAGWLISSAPGDIPCARR